jgi:hypothetical protein
MSVGRVWITDVAVGLSQLGIRLDKLAADGWRVEAVVPIGGPPELTRFLILASGPPRWWAWFTRFLTSFRRPR